MHNIMPTAALRPFVKQFWVSGFSGQSAAAREHVLPTGQMHLVFRLSGPPLRIFQDENDRHGYTVESPVVGGPRSSFYIKDMHAPAATVGVQLLPGAAQALFGVSAAELSQRHTPLSELWGREAAYALEQLQEAPDAQQRLSLLCDVLAERLRAAQVLHPVVAQALHHFDQSQGVNGIVQASQYSHRCFIALFKRSVGLSPKRYARLMRFQKLLARLHAGSLDPLGELALSVGYSDQAHMHREFREFAGLTPLEYRLQAPAAAHHVAVKPAESIGQFYSRQNSLQIL
jgi:methylphosphotriester-DNA--protein-cysteine methyltransferase